jgi:hypothetical protein
VHLRPPLEQRGARPVERALEHVVEQDRAERGPEQHGGRGALAREGEEERRHAGHGDDDGGRAEEGQLEHQHLEPLHLVRADPAQRGLVERLRAAGANAVCHPGERPAEQRRQQGAPEHHEAERGAQVVEAHPRQPHGPEEGRRAGRRRRAAPRSGVPWAGRGRSSALPRAGAVPRGAPEGGRGCVAGPGRGY